MTCNGHNMPMGTSPIGQDASGPGIAARYPDGLVHQGISAELIAAKWKLDRDTLDQYSARSHQQAAHAIAQGWFDREIVPIDVADAAGAEADYRRALALEPDFPDALLGAAALHGNPSADVSADEATAWRQRAARLQPENIDNWLQLARLHDAADRPEQAERARVRAALTPRAEPDIVAQEWPV